MVSGHSRPACMTLSPQPTLGAFGNNKMGVHLERYLLSTYKDYSIKPRKGKAYRSAITSHVTYAVHAWTGATGAGSGSGKYKMLLLKVSQCRLEINPNRERKK